MTLIPHYSQTFSPKHTYKNTLKISVILACEEISDRIWLEKIYICSIIGGEIVYVVWRKSFREKNDNYGVHIYVEFV